MWEVVAKSRLSGIERKRVTDRWERATELAFKALEHGWRVKIKKYYTDILIPDCDSGDYVCVASKVDPREASRFSSDFPQFKHFPYSLSSISQSYQKNLKKSNLLLRRDLRYLCVAVSPSYRCFRDAL